MTRTFPEWAYLVDESGRYWYNLPSRTRQPVAGEEASRPPARAIYAIPSRDLISFAQWVSSKDDEIIDQVVAAETEKFGFKTLEGPGKVTDWLPIEHNGTRTLVQSVSIPWPFEALTGGPTEFSDFLPHYALYPPPENAVTLWKEGDTWVAGYSRAGRWIHVQSLGESNSGPFLAGEVQLTLMELSAKDILPSIREIVVWAPYDVALHQDLETGTGLQVRFEEKPPPQPSSSAAWEFEPHEITREKLAQKSRKRAMWGVFIGLLVLALLVGAGVLHLWSMEKANERLRAKIDANQPEANVIEAAMTRWNSVSAAVDPSRSPIELFYRVSSLLPEKGFRITSFEVQENRRILLIGEASNMQSALAMKGKLEKAENLSDFEWEVTPPRPKGDLVEFTCTGTYRY
ncbi:MAG: hypothetical protein CMO55_05760 [Verrucomicrobiales bacterium]|nr:hypothetical protein [Verrucomicrobiales bacterium]